MRKDYKVPGGTLSVEPFKAEVYTRNDWEAGSLVIEEIPMLRVIGDVRYRGRDYKVHRMWKWGLRYHRGDLVGEGWTQATYDVGVRRADGSPVPYGAATYGVLDTMARDVADEFASEFPTWQHESLALHYRWLIKAADTEVMNLERQLNEAVAKRAALESKYADRI